MSKVVRLDEEAMARLVRLQGRTGFSREEILSRALDHAEGRCGRCGQSLSDTAAAQTPAEPPEEMVAEMADRIQLYAVKVEHPWENAAVTATDLLEILDRWRWPSAAQPGKRERENPSVRWTQQALAQHRRSRSAPYMHVPVEVVEGLLRAAALPGAQQEERK